MIPQGLHYLVVDDSPNMRLVVKRILSDYGVEKITEVDNGNLALEAISKSEEDGNPIDYIICDHNMPFMTGLELLKTVRDNEKYINTPFVLMTSQSDQALVVKFIAAKVSNFVVKPLQKDDFVTRICAAYNKHQPK